MPVMDDEGLSGCSQGVSAADIHVRAIAAKRGCPSFWAAYRPEVAVRVRAGGRK